MPAQMYGVATSGVTLFRSIGGSIGVALFGAVFTHVLQSNLQQLLPEGAVLPPGMNPVAVQHLPADIRLDYLDAFGAAIHAAFLMAAGIMAVAFVLSAVKGGAAEDRDALSGPGDAQQCLTQRRCGKIDKFAQLKRRQIPSGIQQMDRRRIRLDVFQQQTELPVAQAIQRLIMQ